MRKISFSIIVFTIACALKVSAYEFKPASESYVACPNAVVSLAMTPETGVTFYWYDVATSGTALASGNSYNVTKDATALQTWWVEPRDASATYPRIPITLAKSESCGDAVVDCVSKGTLLFREDFGG